jgi:hypothetical protein
MSAAPDEFASVFAPEVDEFAKPDGEGSMLSLPYGLGKLQAYIYGRMKYPSNSTAGVTALAALSAIAQPHITIRSYGGLGLNEQYLILAPTGFGKEDLRGAITDLLDEARMAAPGSPRYSVMQWSAPSSQQGLHELLEAHPAQIFVSDEFAEWLAQTHRDAHKQAALGYLMQIYSKALGVVSVPHAVTRSYEPVKHPRVSILATSTAERILQSMTIGHADSGAYNRWVIHVAEQIPPQKRYEGLKYDPPAEVLELVAWVAQHPEAQMKFDGGGWSMFKREDSEVFDPIKFADPHLAGRPSRRSRWRR